MKKFTKGHYNQIRGFEMIFMLKMPENTYGIAKIKNFENTNYPKSIYHNNYSQV